MTRYLMGTDYTHQSLNDIKSDLKNWVVRINTDIVASKKYISQLEISWQQKKFDNFVSTANRCYKLLNTAKEDIVFVLSEIDEEVKENHIRILKKLGSNGAEFNREIGQAKSAGFLDEGPEYDLYCRLKDSMINLIDLEEVSERLEDFIGKKKKHLPWGIIIANLISLGALLVSILSYIK